MGDKLETEIIIKAFARFPNLLFALSLREDMDMKVHYNFGEDETTLKNREKFLNKLGISGKDVVSVQSVHGANVKIVSREDKGIFISDTDGLITCQKDVFLSITVADCLPIIIFDPKKEILTLLHCGWKGLEENIIQNAVKKLNENFDVELEEVVAGIGPGIGSCHFEVKTDLLQKFKLYPEVIIKKGRKNFIDLKLIAKRQMKELGIKSDNIEISSVCTYCQSDKYFSYRKDKSQPVQAMMVVAGMKQY